LYGKGYEERPLYGAAVLVFVEVLPISEGGRVVVYKGEEVGRGCCLRGVGVAGEEGGALAGL